MNLEKDKDIQIPKQHYVGLVSQKNSMTLGYMAPEGDDMISRKGKNNIDFICNNIATSQTKNPTTFRTIDNKPMLGFRLGKDIRRTYGWGKGNVTWRIEDPRGFELEISNSNLVQILSCCTVENGEILEKCVWGRLKADNVLIPVSSDVYKNAYTNTERMAKHVDSRLLVIGNRMILRNGIEGIFLGKHYGIISPGYENHPHIDISNQKFSFFAELNKFDNDYKIIHAFPSLSVSEILQKDEISSIDSVNLINNHVSSKKTFKFSAYRTLYGAVNTSNRYTKISTILKPTTIDEIKLKSLDNTSLNILVKDKENIYYIGTIYNLHSRMSFDVSKINFDMFINKRIFDYQLTKPTGSFVDRYRNRITRSISVNRCDDYSFYFVSYEISNADGIKFTVTT